MRQPRTTLFWFQQELSRVLKCSSYIEMPCILSKTFINFLEPHTKPHYAWLLYWISFNQQWIEFWNFVLKVNVQYIWHAWFDLMDWKVFVQRNISILEIQPLIAVKFAPSHLVRVRPNKFGGLRPYVYTGFNASYLLVQKFITNVITERRAASDLPFREF